MNTNKHHEGWELRESGPAGADHAVLLLPGALATSAFYDDVLAEPKLSEASVRFVAATLPGFGGTEPPDDLSMENYARLAGKLAADFHCGAVVGHSLGANVAIEMVGAGHFSGPLVLLAPSFSREDESKFPRALDRMSIALGHLPYTAMLKVIGPAMKGSLPPERQDALVAELKKNDPRFLRRQTRRYLEYLDRHGSLVSRLCDSGVRAWVVFGERDDIGLTDDERRALEECPHTAIVTIPDAGHFTLNEEPGRIAELIVEMVSADAPRRKRAGTRDAEGRSRVKASVSAGEPCALAGDEQQASRRLTTQLAEFARSSTPAPFAAFAIFTTLLMSTGLTFGTISSLYGPNAGIIDSTQFSLLVTVVVLSAIVPTAIAQRRFAPDVETELEDARERDGRPRSTTPTRPLPAGEGS